MKRVFALLLIFSLLLACAVFSAGASEAQEILPFSDAASIVHSAEVAIFAELGVVSGNSAGEFQPARTLTRAEVAVLATQLSGGAPLDAPAAADTAGHWASGYIAYALSMGYLTCQPDGRYLPGVMISVRDFCCVLLRVIGYRGFTAAEVDALIDSCGLTSGYYGSLDAFVTRDDACLLMYNAVCNYEIAAQDGSSVSYYIDELMNPLTFLEHHFDVVRYSEMVEANEYGDLLHEDARLEPGLTRIAQHRAFEVSTDLSYLGRRVDIFVRDGAVVGVPRISSDELCVTFPSYLEYLSIVDTYGLQISEEATYYFNYDRSNAACLGETGDCCEITLLDRDHDGVYDVVFVTAYRAATVTGLDTPTLLFEDGSTAELEQIAGSPQLTLGQSVYAVQIAGIWHLLTE